MSATARIAAELDGDSGDGLGDGVRRSNRKRTIKRFDSPSPPPGKRVKDTSRLSVNPSIVKAKPGTSTATLFGVDGRNAGAGPSGMSQAKAAQLKNKNAANTPSAKGVKPTKVWLSKTNADDIEDDPLVDEDVRKRIAELRAENDTLASSNTSYSRQILRVGDKLSKLRRKLEEGAERDSVEGIVKKAKELLTPVPGLMFACELRNCGRAPGTRRFTEPDLLAAYAIYKQSTRCYLFLSKVLTLPGLEGLLQWVAKVEPEPGKGLGKEFYETRNLGHLLDPVPFPGISAGTAKRIRKKKNAKSGGENGETSAAAGEGTEEDKGEGSASAAGTSAETAEGGEATQVAETAPTTGEEPPADTLTFVV